jgi:hypothetical protein
MPQGLFHQLAEFFAGLAADYKKAPGFGLVVVGRKGRRFEHALDFLAGRTVGFNFTDAAPGADSIKN